jgi:hypothetical protein
MTLGMARPISSSASATQIAWMCERTRSSFARSMRGATTAPATIRSERRK